jgi:hypothetical protein
MGQKRVLYAAQARREWSRVIPGSDDEVEMEVACRSDLALRGIGEHHQGMEADWAL